MGKPISNLIGIDDGPFTRSSRDVPLVGVVMARTRVDGVVVSRARRDGNNSTARIVGMIRDSAFASHVRAVLLQGITVAGFNVVDILAVHDALAMPVLVVTRKKPRLCRIRAALLEHVPGGARKWALIKRVGPMEPLSGLFVHRVGLTEAQARDLLAHSTTHGKLPEPLRLAHMTAAALVTGHSHGRA